MAFFLFSAHIFGYDEDYPVFLFGLIDAHSFSVRLCETPINRQLLRWCLFGHGLLFLLVFINQHWLAGPINDVLVNDNLADTRHRRNIVHNLQ